MLERPAMRKLVVALALFSLVGCNLLKKHGNDADASVDAAAEAAAPAPGDTDAGPTGPSTVPVTAKNINDVARFPAETAIADDDAKLLQATAVRSSPKGGTVVATLPAGTDPVKVAEYQTYFLVTFADPKDASSTLAGWIDKVGFTAPTVIVKHDAGAAIVDAGTPPAPAKDAGAPTSLTCPRTHVPVMISTAPSCKKRCGKDTDCKTHTVGSCANASLVGGGVAKVCVND